MLTDQITRRYENDCAFARVVDALQGVLDQGLLTPSELREAAVYACIRREMYAGARFVFKDNELNRVTEAKR